MPEAGTLYAVGEWKVKDGREREFTQAWLEFALWTAKHVRGAGVGRLLQDANDPTRFISFGPWSGLEAARTWREPPEFKAFFLKAREMCQTISPQTLNEVASTQAD